MIKTGRIQPTTKNTIDIDHATSRFTTSHALWHGIIRGSPSSCVLRLIRTSFGSQVNLLQFGASVAPDVRESRNWNHTTIVPNEDCLQWFPATTVDEMDMHFLCTLKVFTRSWKFLSSGFEIAKPHFDQLTIQNCCFNVMPICEKFNGQLGHEEATHVQWDSLLVHGLLVGNEEKLHWAGNSCYASSLLHRKYAHQTAYFNTVVQMQMPWTFTHIC